MDLLKIKVDSRKIEDGAWVGKAHGTPIPGLGDAELLVRGPRSSAYQAALARLVDALPPDSREANGDLKPEVAKRVTDEAIAEALLLGWKVTLGGEPLVFSSEKALEILSDPDFVVFREGVLHASAEVGRYREEAVKVDAKN
jgi:hypothetical protein